MTKRQKKKALDLEIAFLRSLKYGAKLLSHSALPENGMPTELFCVALGVYDAGTYAQSNLRAAGHSRMYINRPVWARVSYRSVRHLIDSVNSNGMAVSACGVRADATLHYLRNYPNTARTTRAECCSRCLRHENRWRALNQIIPSNLPEEASV